MTSPSTSTVADCTIVGASFAGLACATVLARRGLRVVVLERKADPGERLHTTGIIVKEVVDQIALLDALPKELVRQVPGVRLYAPNMRYVDLDAPGYYFLATDTPNVLRWLAAQARQYDRMRVLFERAYALLPETIDQSTAPLALAIYLELGQEAMAENAEWVAIYRQRPIQPPR